MQRLLLEIERPPTLESVREMRHLLLQAGQVAVPYPSVLQRILLCFAEAATNLVLHANPPPGLIGVRFGRNNNAWWIDIIDDADPWDPTQYKASNILDVFAEEESGRGTAILQIQSEDIEYHSGNGIAANRLRLSWYVPNQSKRPTILIVEDDNALRRLYTAYLENNYNIVAVTDGHEAIQQLEKVEVDLVLSDIQMPQMSGLSLRAYLNKQRKTELIPFIFLTGVNDSKMQQQATDLGVDDYLIKPVNKTQLIHIIQRVLNRSLQIYKHLTDRIDQRITSALAPNLPATAHGWRLCVASRHTGVGGGDLILHRNSDDRLMLAVVDIMGHDDSAKFFAYAYGGYLRGLIQTSNDDLSPSELLEKFSQSALHDELLSQVIMTSCVATLSTDGKITLASAGHPPPLKVNKKGIEVIDVSGMLPGLLDDVIYDAETLHLKPGERIALFTDGLFESAADNDSRKNLETLVTTALGNTLNISIEQSLQQAMAVFDEYAGTPPRDDALLLLMEVIE